MYLYVTIVNNFVMFIKLTLRSIIWYLVINYLVPSIMDIIIVEPDSY